MYTFWIVVIGFSMLTLIMVYTYQFDGIDTLLQNYMDIEL